MVELKQMSSVKKTNVKCKENKCNNQDGNMPQDIYHKKRIYASIYQFNAIDLIMVTVMGVRRYTFACSYFESCIQSVKTEVWCDV